VPIRLAAGFVVKKKPPFYYEGFLFDLVAGVGFEPTTFGLFAPYVPLSQYPYLSNLLLSENLTFHPNKSNSVGGLARQRV